MSENPIAPTGKCLRDLEGKRETEAILPPTDTPLSLAATSFAVASVIFEESTLGAAGTADHPYSLSLGGKPELTSLEFCSSVPYNCL